MTALNRIRLICSIFLFFLYLEHLLSFDLTSNVFLDILALLMKRFWLLTILLLLVSFIYFFFSPVSVRNKRVYFVDNFFNINDELKPLPIETFDGFFYNDSECGYFSVDKGMGFYNEVEEPAIILANKYFYLTYEKVGESVEVFTPLGEKISEISTYGYPYITGDFPLFYVLKTNGFGFTLFSMKGEPMINDISYTSLITSINTDNEYNTLVSTLDGATYMYDSKGEEKFKSEYEGSDIIMTKSNAIEIKGNNIAICSGLGPETIEIFTKDSGTRVLEFETNSSYVNENILEFKNNRLYYETDNGLIYYDMHKNSQGNIDVLGEIREISFDQKGNIVVASFEKDIYYLTIYNPNGIKKYYKEFSESVSDLTFIDESTFYFRISDTICKMVLGENV